MKTSEHQLQVSIIDYVNKVLPSLRPYIFAVPNGGLRNVIVAKKLKDEGVMAGVPDLFIDIPNTFKHGLRIEVKIGKNKFTINQMLFKERMEDLGYVVKECRSIEDFESILCEYFELKKLTNQEIFSRIQAEQFIQDKIKRKYDDVGIKEVKHVIR
jgi:hypothetical protein